MIYFTESYNGKTRRGEPVKKFRMYVPYSVVDDIAVGSEAGLTLRNLVHKFARKDDKNNRFVMQSWRILMVSFIPVLDRLVRKSGGGIIDKEKYQEWRKRLVEYRDERRMPGRRRRRRLSGQSPHTT